VSNAVRATTALLEECVRSFDGEFWRVTQTA